MGDRQHPRSVLPADAIDAATFKIDESHTDEALLEVALIPKGRDVKPQIFFIGLKKVKREVAGQLLGAALRLSRPERGLIEHAGRGVAGFSSPRFRRRA